MGNPKWFLRIENNAELFRKNCNAIYQCSTIFELCRKPIGSQVVRKKPPLASAAPVKLVKILLKISLSSVAILPLPFSLNCLQTMFYYTRNMCYILQFRKLSSVQDYSECCFGYVGLVPANLPRQTCRPSEQLICVESFNVRF